MDGMLLVYDVRRGGTEYGQCKVDKGKGMGSEQNSDRGRVLADGDIADIGGIACMRVFIRDAGTKYTHNRGDISCNDGRRFTTLTSLQIPGTRGGGIVADKKSKQIKVRRHHTGEKMPEIKLKIEY